MASSSSQPGAAKNKSILTPVMTLEGHKPWTISLPDGKHPEYKDVSSISYFPDGKQMISGSDDKTIRRWDLREGKEIEEVQEVCEYRISAVGVSRDGRWVVSADRRSLKVNEVETGTVRTFHDDKDNFIDWIDISADNTLLAGASIDLTARIWSLDTGELVAGPFKISAYDGYPVTLSFRLSEDSKKLVVLSNWGQDLQVWDIQAQTLDVQRYTPNRAASILRVPVFWTTKDKSIIAPFKLTDDHFVWTIYEFDASTLETVGDPFKHDGPIQGLALSSDCALLASSALDDAIKLWSIKSHQLLASFDVKFPFTLILSPDSRQLAYTSEDDSNIYICNIPANILASIELAVEPQPSTSKPKRSYRNGLLNSDATRRPVRRNPVIAPVVSPIPRPLPTKDSHTFLRFIRKLLSSSSRTDAVRIDEPRNPLDFPATSPLPRPLIKPDENSQPTLTPPATQSSTINASATLISNLHRISTWRPFQINHASPSIVNVPLAPGKLRYATAGAPVDDDDLIRDEDYVSPPPSPNPGSQLRSNNPGQHGSGRFCFCF